MRTEKEKPLSKRKTANSQKIFGKDWYVELSALYDDMKYLSLHMVY